MIVLIGPSASGKTEIAKYLIKHFGYKKCVTTTTRDKRIGEMNDVDYHFVTKNVFETYIKEKRFIEYNIYQNQYYGLLKADIEENGIVILDPNGANAALKLGLDVYIIYVQVSTKERHKRMLKRGDDLHMIESRIESDDTLFDISKINRVDSIIDNHGDLSQTAIRIHQDYQNKSKKVLV